jgi:hypothetical protein
MSDVSGGMSTLHLSADTADEQVVRAPRPADAIGAALRGAFGVRALPGELARLVRELHRIR